MDSVKNNTKEIMFLCGNGNHPLASETLRNMSELFGQTCKFDHINFNTFPEGELDNRIPNYSKIKDKTVVIFQSMWSQKFTTELLDLSWACKKQYGAKKIIAVISFLENRRQDPKMEIKSNDFSGKKAKPDEIQRLRMLIDNLNHNGIDEMIVVTPHSEAMSEAAKEFNIIFHEIDPSSLFIEKVRTFVPENDTHLIKVYAPDLGSVKRAYKFAKIFNCSILFNLKNRIIYNETSIAKVNKEELDDIVNGLRKKYNFSKINYSTTDLVAGKIIVMIEDEVSSGGTANDTGKYLKKMGAKSIIFIATHAVLTPGWRNKLFHENPFEKIIMTNTIQRDYEKRTGGQIVDISIAPLIASKLFQILS